MKSNTQYAPAERADAKELQRQIQLIRQEILTRQLLDALPLFVTVLNKHRQFVFLNKTMVSYLGYSTEDEILGLRPGEAVHCIHAYENDAGCGTTEFCRYCGAVNAILEAQRGVQNEKECRIIVQDNKALDFLVWATPITIKGEPFTIFALKDIKHTNRLRALEKIFFHDLLNTTGALKGFANLIAETDDCDEIKEYSGFIGEISERIVEEIKEQRDLTAAENNELNVTFENISVKEIISGVVVLYKNNNLAEGKIIKTLNECGDEKIFTDKILLRRVLSNMLKNALEACDQQSVVTIGCKKVNNEFDFWIHNNSFMPDYVQKQVFQRSFSTKGPNRGFGTYSIKLLSEKYLGGRVYFETSKEKGTTFHAVFPK